MESKRYFWFCVPYIKIGEINVSDGTNNSIRDINKKKQAPSRAKQIVRNKDIIVSTPRPTRWVFLELKILKVRR